MNEDTGSFIVTLVPMSLGFFFLQFSKQLVQSYSKPS